MLIPISPISVHNKIIEIQHQSTKLSHPWPRHQTTYMNKREETFLHDRKLYFHQKELFFIKILHYQKLYQGQNFRYELLLFWKKILEVEFELNLFRNFFEYCIEKFCQLFQSRQIHRNNEFFMYFCLLKLRIDFKAKAKEQYFYYFFLKDLINLWIRIHPLIWLCTLPG